MLDKGGTAMDLRCKILYVDLGRNNDDCVPKVEGEINEFLSTKVKKFESISVEYSADYCRWVVTIMYIPKI